MQKRDGEQEGEEDCERQKIHGKDFLILILEQLFGSKTI
jgi:hypothetical protein